MEEQSYVLKYREKHPRCRYCKFKKHIIPGATGAQYAYDKCTLKDIILRDYLLCTFLSNIQGCFCRGFKATDFRKE